MWRHALHGKLGFINSEETFPRYSQLLIKSFARTQEGQFLAQLQLEVSQVSDQQEYSFEQHEFNGRRADEIAINRPTESGQAATATTTAAIRRCSVLRSARGQRSGRDRDRRSVGLGHLFALGSREHVYPCGFVQHKEDQMTGAARRCDRVTDE